MPSRIAPLPEIWLMTDERGGDPVALARRLPKKAGIVFRHHGTPAAERRALYKRVRRVAQRRKLTLLLAGTPSQARQWGADGAHHRSLLVSKGLRSVAVHNRGELALARRIAADLIFVSPVFPTRSHPGATPLGAVRTGLLLGTTRRNAVALGGLDRTHFRKLQALKIHGWAAIDAFGQA